MASRSKSTAAKSAFGKMGAPNRRGHGTHEHACCDSAPSPGKPMQLLIDLGNTRLKWALAEAGELRTRGARAHGGAGIAHALEREWAQLPTVARAFVASVAPLAIDMDIEVFVQQRFGITPDFVRSPASALGVRNAYAEPQRLGVDRFLGLAAAHAAEARAQVLVGVGTAMTLDALDSDGTHLGGWIVPSPALMREA